MVRLTLLAIAVTRLSCATPAVPVGSSIISPTISWVVNFEEVPVKVVPEPE